MTFLLHLQFPNKSDLDLFVNNSDQFSSTKTSLKLVQNDFSYISPDLQAVSHSKVSKLNTQKNTEDDPN